MRRVREHHVDRGGDELRGPNIFEYGEIVSQYPQSRKIPSQAFEEACDTIVDDFEAAFRKEHAREYAAAESMSGDPATVKLVSRLPVHALEVGPGTGRATIPWIKRMDERFSLSYYGVDVSDHMTVEARKAVSKGFTGYTEPVYADFGGISITNRDMADVKAGRVFDTALLSFVAHTLDDFKPVVDKVLDCMVGGGRAYFIRSDCDWYRLIAGDRPAGGVEPETTAFWREYARVRAERGLQPHDAVKRLYDLSDVREHLESRGWGLDEKKVDGSKYSFSYSFRDFLDMIGDGTYTALGSNLSGGDRKMLHDHMSRWVRENRVDLDKRQEFGSRLVVAVASRRS